MFSWKFLIVSAVLHLSEARGSLEKFNKANLIFFYGHDSAIYSRYKIPDLTQLLTHNYFDYKKPTVIYIFGWTQSPFSDSTKSIIENYLRRSDHNVLLLDWSDYSVRPLYTSMLNISKIARIFGRAFIRLFHKGMNVGRFHCIGHSFGAHGCGIMAREVYESSGGFLKFGRITGLDSARLGFFPPLFEAPLSRKDAHFVDTIHTDNFFIGGTWEPIGHTSFFVNNATLQPGCSKEFTSIYDTLSIWCSHYRAIDYYALTLNPQHANSFPGYQCSNYDLFRQGWCSLNPTNILGFYARPDIPGKFYVEIESAPTTFDKRKYFFYTLSRTGDRIGDFINLNFLT